MIVVSDATPFSNLIQVGRLDLLRQLFGTVYIPSSVTQELEALTQFDYPMAEILDEPWIIIEDIEENGIVAELRRSLDVGEADAIAMALEKRADRLLIDEIAGRTIAKSKNISIIGTLGVLLESKDKGLIAEVKVEMDRLKDIGFWISSSLYNQVINLEKRIG
jgi:predicted nucleic acid-binding protein